MSITVFPEVCLPPALVIFSVLALGTPLLFVCLDEGSGFISDQASFGLPRVGGRGPLGGKPTAGVEEYWGTGVAMAGGRVAWMWGDVHIEVKERRIVHLLFDYT